MHSVDLSSLFPYTVLATAVNRDKSAPAQSVRVARDAMGGALLGTKESGAAIDSKAGMALDRLEPTVKDIKIIYVSGSFSETVYRFFNIYNLYSFMMLISSSFFLTETVQIF